LSAGVAQLIVSQIDIRIIMGAFYTNYVLHFSDRLAVARALTGRSAVVIGPINDCIAIFDEESRTPDIEVGNHQ